MIPKHGRLPLSPWLQERPTRWVMRALGGGRGEVRFVGGCVRDSLLGRAVRDVDLAVQCRPGETMRRLRRAGLPAIPIGYDHGVVMTFLGGRRYEIASLRCDVATDGRHARVLYGRDWRQDACRRDFTINALYADTHGWIYDPFGGWSDLRRGVVRFVGKAHARVREDRLRILRYYRFFSRYGRGRPDAAAGRACRDGAAGLSDISAERIWSELRCLLESPTCRRGLDLMATHGVLSCILPEAGHRDVLASLLKLTTERAPIWGDGAPIRRLAALLRPQADSMALAQRLKMSRRDGKRLNDLHAALVHPPPMETARDVKSLIYQHGRMRAADLVFLCLAARGETRMPPGWEDMLMGWACPSFPVSGRDILALGLTSGPDVGEVLATVRTWWRESDFQPDRDACLAYAARVVSSSRGETCGGGDRHG